MKASSDSDEVRRMLALLGWPRSTFAKRAGVSPSTLTRGLAAKDHPWEPATLASLRACFMAQAAKLAEGAGIPGPASPPGIDRRMMALAIATVAEIDGTRLTPGQLAHAIGSVYNSLARGHRGETIAEVARSAIELVLGQGASEQAESSKD